MMGEYVQRFGVIEQYDGVTGLVRGPTGCHKFYRAFVLGYEEKEAMRPGCKVFYYVSPYSKFAFYVTKLH